MGDTDQNMILSILNFSSHPIKGGGSPKFEIPVHVFAKDLRKRIPKHIWNNYYKFTFVRNPWDWQVSIYHYIISQKSNHHHKLVKGMSGFDEYIRWRVFEDKHLQKEFVVDEQGNSLWTLTLAVLFREEQLLFKGMLPSQVQNNVYSLQETDVILLDINFSGDKNYQGKSEFGGLEILTRIHSDLPHIPVIIMSHYDEISLYQKCLTIGCYDYLTKSWSNYSKFKIEESERDWFFEWRQALMTPISYQSFFRDALLFEKK